jgi:hypothetical protein
LRLHRPGGVGLGPHGWVRVAGDRWRRIGTGAPRPRSGGYSLSEEQIPELTELARTIAVHGKRVSRLRRALLRFESGLDRRGAVDALNDHLLGLRFLLEGQGPAGVGLPMRVAALASPGEERVEVKLAVERAIGLERELWSGEPAGSGGASPALVATRIEELLRTILRRGVSGELGGDLRAAADETLIADGLAVGEGAAGEVSTSEWELEPDPASSEEEGVEVAEALDRLDAERVPEITAAAPAPERAEAPDQPRAWLEEVDEGPREPMQFPRRGAGANNHLDELSKPPMEREEVKARVAYLFPRTETDWTIGASEPRRKAAAS